MVFRELGLESQLSRQAGDRSKRVLEALRRQGVPGVHTQPICHATRARAAGGRDGETSAEEPRGVATSGELAQLRGQVATLTAQLQAAKAPGQQPPSPGQGGSKMPSKQVTTKTCHVCGSGSHLKAECPHALEVHKLQQWLEVLQSDSCMLSPQLREQQLAEAQCNRHSD